MATTGIVEAKLVGLYIGASLIVHSTNCELNATMETRDITTKSSANNNKEVAPSYKNWTMNGDFELAFDAAYGFSDLFAAWNARTLLTVKISTEVTGDDYYSGSAYITNLRLGAGDGDNAKCSVSLQGTGALAEAQVSA